MYLCQKLRELWGSNGSKTKAARVDMNSESEDFKELFPQGMTYLPSGRTESAFKHVEEVVSYIKHFVCRVFSHEAMIYLYRYC